MPNLFRVHQLCPGLMCWCTVLQVGLDKRTHHRSDRLLRVKHVTVVSATDFHPNINELTVHPNLDAPMSREATTKTTESDNLFFAGWFYNSF